MIIPMNHWQYVYCHNQAKSAYTVNVAEKKILEILEERFAMYDRLVWDEDYGRILEKGRRTA